MDEIELKIFDPCPSIQPIFQAMNVNVMSVQCNKQRDHEGNHEWTIKWQDEKK